MDVVRLNPKKRITRKKVKNKGGKERGGNTTEVWVESNDQAEMPKKIL